MNGIPICLSTSVFKGLNQKNSSRLSISWNRTPFTKILKWPFLLGIQSTKLSLSKSLIFLQYLKVVTIFVQPVVSIGLSVLISVVNADVTKYFNDIVLSLLNFKPTALYSKSSIKL